MFHGFNTANMQVRKCMNSVPSKIDTYGTASAVNIIFVVGGVKIFIMH